MLVLLTNILNASQSQDWCHCCNRVQSIFVMKYTFNHCKSFIQVVSKVTYQYTGISLIIYRYVSLKTPCIYRAKSTDRDKLTANKLIANQRFCYSDFVTKWGFGQDGSGDSKKIFRIALLANQRCSRSVGLRLVVVDLYILYFFTNLAQKYYKQICWCKWQNIILMGLSPNHCYSMSIERIGN